LGEIFPHIEVSSLARLVFFYPGKAVQLPEVFEE
ncbi:unnamed protein product, partial [marine sediment metagenome]